MSSVPSLNELQEWMATQLRRRRDLTRDAEVIELANRFFTGSDRLSPVEQLEIYREQFWLRHTSSLADDFPGLRALLGQSAWERLVEEYLENVVPGHPSLRDLGQLLPDFVAAAEWLEHPALCLDMTRLEWAFIEIFDAPDTSRLSVSKLAGISEHAWENARVLLNPALRLLRVEYPVAELRRLLQSHREPSAIPRAPSCLVLYRSAERALSDESVGSTEFALLSNLHAGMPLVPACEAVLRTEHQDPEHLEKQVSEWFRGWAERGWVSDVVAGAALAPSPAIS